MLRTIYELLKETLKKSSKFNKFDFRPAASYEDISKFAYVGTCNGSQQQVFVEPSMETGKILVGYNFGPIVGDVGLVLSPYISVVPSGESMSLGTCSLTHSLFITRVAMTYNGKNEEYKPLTVAEYYRTIDVSPLIK